LANITSLPPREVVGNTGQQDSVNTNLITNFKNFNIVPIQYPIDLGDKDLKHWVSFTINVKGKSFLSPSRGARLGNERNLGEVVRGPDSANLSADQLATASNIARPTAGALAGSAIGATIGGLTKLGGAGRVGGILGLGAGFVAEQSAEEQGLLDLLKPDTSYKISDAIALYVDGPPTVRYAAQYSNKDLGILAGIAGGGSDMLETGKAEAGTALLLQFAKLPSALGVAGNLADTIGKAAGVAVNPFREVLFEAIDFRSFSFKYRFFPKSRQEADNVERIIKLFKFHMHPDLSTNKLFFIYPSEFEIGYYFQNKENTYFHKFKPCALESIEVSYGGEQFSTFFDGNPTEVNMTLTFRELEILTKAQIKDGY
jgi:hypothetical protein